MSGRGRLWAAIKLDVKLQAVSRLYAVGVGAAVLLGLIVRFLVPTDAHALGLAAFYLLAIGGTTFMFSAVMFLRDRSQNTLAALRVSPMDAKTYVAAKVVTLSAFALVESAVVYLVSGAWAVPIAPLAAGALILGVTYALFGLAQVAPHDSVLKFIMPGALVTSLILQLPVFYLAAVGPPLLYYVVPSMPALLIMRSAGRALEPAEWAYAAGFGAVVLGFGARLAVARMRRYAGLR